MLLLQDLGKQQNNYGSFRLRMLGSTEPIMQFRHCNRRNRLI